jgi:hypothetical protein
MSARVCVGCGSAYREMNALEPMCICPRCQRKAENAPVVYLIPHNGRVELREHEPWRRRGSLRRLVRDFLPVILLGGAWVWVLLAVFR